MLGSHSGRRFDVLINRKKIIWIILGLYSCEATVVVSVRGLDALLSLVHHEVDVSAPGRMWMERLPIISGPGNDLVFIGRIRIHADDYLSPFRIAISPCSLVLSDAGRRSVDRIEVHGRLHCRQLGAMFQMLLDGCV